MKHPFAITLIFFISILSIYSQSNVDSLVSRFSHLEPQEWIPLLEEVTQDIINQDPEQVVTLGRWGLSAVSETTDKVRLHLLIGQAFNYLPNQDSAMEHLEKGKALLALSPNDKLFLRALNLEGNILLDNGETKEGLPIRERQLELARSLNDSLEISVALNNIAIIHTRMGNYDQALYFNEQSLAMNVVNNDKTGQAFAYYQIGVNNDLLSNFSASASAFVKALALFEELENTRMIGATYNSLGIIHAGQQLYQEAIKYYRACAQIRLEQGNLRGLALQKMNLGKLYAKVDSVQLAGDYFVQSIALSREINNAYILCQVYVEYGDFLFFTNRQQEAQKYINLGLDLSQQLSDKYAQSRALTLLAQMEIQNRNFDQVASTLREVQLLAEDLQAPEVMLEYYELASTLALLNQDVQKGKQLRDSHKNLRDSVYNKEKTQLMADVLGKFKYEQKEKELELSQIKVQKQQEILKRQSLIILCSLLALISIAILLVYFRYRYQTKQKLQLLETQRVKSELHNNQHQLSMKTLHMMRMNDNLNDLQQRISELQPKVGSHAHELQKIGTQIKLHKARDKDWENFDLLFQGTHLGFIESLKEKSPDLSLKDVRLCCLLKMHMNTEEIASIMNIEAKSVRMSKYRIKKKLGLDPEQDLVDYLHNQGSQSDHAVDRDMVLI